MKIPALSTVWRLAHTQTVGRLVYGHVGRRSIIYRPMLVVGGSNISIGHRSAIREFSRLETIAQTGNAWTPRLKIGNEVNIEQGVHIVCHCEVTIGDRVSITPYCVIVDTEHPFDEPGHGKIGARLPTQPSYVRIGEGSFIGAHSVVLPNVTIGRFCVIGAGSVVSRDVPDYAVAAGSPARVIKVFDPNIREWRKV
jgi:acetyltransferase-like isoleucine patch superfamily enzyme